MTTSCAGKKQTIVEFESLAWRYDDLFSRSRVGTQRGAVWEVLADVFRPGDVVLMLNCRTREDEIFLALLDVSVVARDAAEGMIDAELRSGRTFDGALANFSGLHSITNFQQTARDLACLVTMGAPLIVCVSTRFCLSETLWFYPRVLNLLRLIDRHVPHLPFVRTIGDHMLLYFERVQR